MLYKHFPSKNQQPGFFISRTQFENGSMSWKIMLSSNWKLWKVSDKSFMKCSSLPLFYWKPLYDPFKKYVTRKVTFLIRYHYVKLYHYFLQSPLREKYPNTEFFSGPYFCAFGLNTESPYSVRMRENTNQKKTPYLNAFHAVPPPLVSLRSEKLWHETKKVKNTKK